jgi:ABC-type branched-subunit amino acid transport system ATPase component
MILEVQDLKKRFGGVVAVDGFGFFVKEKEILGLIGPNGAGKTTVFNLIMGDLKKDSGKVFFKGKEITNLKTHEIVKLGMVRTYQIPKPFYDMTVGENIEIGMISDGVKAILGRGNYDITEIAKATGLIEHLSKMPNELTAGQLHRLELARALSTNPELILVDEVFAGLTAEEVSSISKTIKNLQEKITFVIVDHNLRALGSIVDRVIVIHRGQKVTEGTFKEVAIDERVRKVYMS